MSVFIDKIKYLSLDYYTRNNKKKIDWGILKSNTIKIIKHLENLAVS